MIGRSETASPIVTTVAAPDCPWLAIAVQRSEDGRAKDEGEEEPYARVGPMLSSSEFQSADPIDASGYECRCHVGHHQ